MNRKSLLWTIIVAGLGEWIYLLILLISVVFPSVSPLNPYHRGLILSCLAWVIAYQALGIYNAKSRLNKALHRTVDGFSFFGALLISSLLISSVMSGVASFLNIDLVVAEYRISVITLTYITSTIIGLALIHSTILGITRSKVSKDILVFIRDQIFFPGMDTPPAYKLIDSKIWGLKLGEDYCQVTTVKCADGEFELEVLSSAQLAKSYLPPHPPLKITEEIIEKISEKGVEMIKDAAKQTTLGKILTMAAISKDYAINNIPFTITSRAKTYREPSYSEPY